MYVKKVWGSEEWIVNRDYCGKLLWLNRGYQCSLHYHKIKHETFYLLDGLVWMTVNGTSFLLQPGESVEIEPCTQHRFAGRQNSLILEVSTHHDDDDVYRLEESGPVFWNTN